MSKSGAGSPWSGQLSKSRTRGPARTWVFHPRGAPPRAWSDPPGAVPPPPRAWSAPRRAVRDLGRVKITIRPRSFRVAQDQYLNFKIDDHPVGTGDHGTNGHTKKRPRPLPLRGATGAASVSAPLTE